MANDNVSHYFASSVYGWNVAATEDEALATRLKVDGRAAKRRFYVAAIVFVPLPIEAPYQISHYFPQVEGARQVLEYGVDEHGKTYRDRKEETTA